MLARVLMAQFQPDRALGLLERLDALAASQGRTGSLLQIRGLRSLAWQAAGDHQGALTGAVAFAATAVEQRDWPHENAPSSPCSGSTV